jgi:putative ABC transport system permease protein
MLETQDSDTTLYKVDAVIEDVPKNSHFDYEFFFSMENVDYEFGHYLSHNFYSYVLLKEGVDHQAFNTKFQDVILKYILPQLNQYIQIDNLADFEAKGNKLSYSLEPLTDIHLHSSREFEIKANGNIQYVYIFSATALFILLIACINFMNLTTARASGRAKEVGIRKVLGTERKSLIGQFLIESILVVTIALGLALFFVWGLLGWFNTISGKEILISSLLDYRFIVFLGLLPIVVGIFAGIYPAFFLSAFKPISVLKGTFTSGHKKHLLRNSLVVFQFATSIILIVGTIVIYQQLNHIQNTNIGFNKEQVLVIDNSGIPMESRLALRNEVEAISDVTSASFAGFLPISASSRSDTTFSTETVMTEDNGFNMQNWTVDYEYISNLGMEMVDGRDFSREFGTDSTAVILNESAVELAGFKDDPIGKHIYTSDRNRNITEYTVIGVVKDFNFESLRQDVGALSMFLGDNSWVSAYRVETSDIFSLISKIEDKYRSFSTSMPFDYNFLDEQFNDMYRQEQSVGMIAITFAILAIIIACLGLFGLATYIAEQRTKEIGIRKVLGATVPNIIAMLSADFIKLVVLAFIIGAPLAWFLMNKWLEDFAYRISLSWWIFAVTVVLALCIALLTLSFRAIKAALANPVTSLRTE